MKKYVVSPSTFAHDAPDVAASDRSFIGWEFAKAFGKPVTRCKNCLIENTMECHIKRALVVDGQCDESACVAPGGFCAWGKSRGDES
jgi:hypothetical protein